MGHYPWFHSAGLTAQRIAERASNIVAIVNRLDADRAEYDQHRSDTHTGTQSDRVRAAEMLSPREAQFRIAQEEMRLELQELEREMVVLEDAVEMQADISIETIQDTVDAISAMLDPATGAASAAVTTDADLIPVEPVEPGAARRRRRRSREQ